MDLGGELASQLDRLGIRLEEEALSALLQLQAEMLRWNRTHNLTAITDPVTAIEKHLCDSLTLLPLLNGRERLLDIGSGAGFPALPLKIARPGLDIVSVDAVAKKIAFQKHAARILGLSGFAAWHGRVEDLPQDPLGVERFDVVVARAFSGLPQLFELACPCLRPGGRIIAMKGPEGMRELQQAEESLKRHGLTCLRVHDITLPGSGSERKILEFSH